MVNTTEVIREAFNFLMKQRYPCADVVMPLRNYLSDKFNLENGNCDIINSIAAYSYFQFTYIEDCLVTDKSIRAEMGKEKPISFKLKEKIDIELLIEKTFKMLPKNN